MSYYDLIPERVHVISSVSPKKTQQFTNAYGQFVYHHIKSSAYNHFVQKQDEFTNRFYIAVPERALLDYLYFKTSGLKKIDSDWFAHALRLQNTEILNKNLLTKIAKCYTQKKLLSIVESLKNFLKHQ